MTKQETDAVQAPLGEWFDGYVLLGFPVDQPFPADHGPAVKIVSRMGVPKMQRTVTMLRMLADDIEGNIRYWNMVADQERNGPPPPPPPLPGDEWEDK